MGHFLLFSLEQLETVTVAASTYLAELPQWQRETGLRVILSAIGLIKDGKDQDLDVAQQASHTHKAQQVPSRNFQ